MPRTNEGDSLENNPIMWQNIHFKMTNNEAIWKLFFPLIPNQKRRNHLQSWKFLALVTQVVRGHINPKKIPSQ